MKLALKVIVGIAIILGFVAIVVLLSAFNIFAGITLMVIGFFIVLTLAFYYKSKLL